MLCCPSLLFCIANLACLVCLRWGQQATFADLKEVGLVTFGCKRQRFAHHPGSRWGSKLLLRFLGKSARVTWYNVLACLAVPHCAVTAVGAAAELLCAMTVMKVSATNLQSNCWSCPLHGGMLLTCGKLAIAYTRQRGLTSSHAFVSLILSDYGPGLPQGRSGMHCIAGSPCQGGQQAQAYSGRSKGQACWRNTMHQQQREQCSHRAARMA